MIEKTILDYLTARLTVPVRMETPEDPPESYVVQSIAPTLYGAAQLNETVKAAMDAMEDRVAGIFRVELNSDYNFTNTATKERRYQAVYNITYKE